MREEGVRGHILVLGPREQGGQRIQELGRVAQGPVLVQSQLEHVLAQEHDRLRAREDPHVRRQAELERELPDQAVPERMERRDRRVRVAVRHQLVHADLHLVRGLVREREGQDLRRTRALGGDEPGDPARDDRRLAGTRARDDQQRSVAVHDRPALLGVEPLEQLVRAGGHRTLLDGRLDCAPDRDLDERLRLATARAAPHRAHRTRREGWSVTRRGGGASGGGHDARVGRARASSGVTGRMAIRPSRIPSRTPGRCAGPPPPRPTAPHRPCRR